ncbi:hypothetical protein acdb102_17490 [Acidothermaceae bacterium B102]|nr:hypothetical protein acdb102_17490 [Acidothermaceae bacterium B102]
MSSNLAGRTPANVFDLMALAAAGAIGVSGSPDERRPLSAVLLRKPYVLLTPGVQNKDLLTAGVQNKDLLTGGVQRIRFPEVGGVRRRDRGSRRT